MEPKETAEAGDIEVRPVDRNNWADFEAFFESKGRLRYCWCTVWRMSAEERKTSDPATRKAFTKDRVWSGIRMGLLAYAAGQPVGWCSVAPRETFRRLGGDDSLQDVWSITCFFIAREFRGRGLVHHLIEEAKAFVAAHGAKYLEAYPVDPESPSYRFMGFVSTFERAGFHHVKDAGTRRHVMVRAL